MAKLLVDAKAALDAKNRSGRGTRVEISGSTGFVEAQNKPRSFYCTQFFGRFTDFEADEAGGGTL